jgi:hypothetical protein
MVCILCSIPVNIGMLLLFSFYLVVSGLTKDILRDHYFLAFTFNAAARGGEAKYLHYWDFLMDFYLGCLDVVWRETKTVSQYRLAFVPDRCQWTTDIFHAMASYWAFGGV